MMVMNYVQVFGNNAYAGWYPVGTNQEIVFWYMYHSDEIKVSQKNLEPNHTTNNVITISHQFLNRKSHGNWKVLRALCTHYPRSVAVHIFWEHKISEI